jgi:cytoskeleton protein RodZ
MSELGKELKKRREELGFSLSEASLSTKISVRMISALEKGDFQILPALPFAKGFVRSYASYLKLDPDQMVHKFVSELGEPEEPKTPVYEAEKPEKASAPSVPVDVNEDSGGIMRFVIIGGVVVLIAAIVGVKSIVDKYQKEGDVSPSPEVSVSPIEKSEPAKEPLQKVEETSEENTSSEASKDAPKEIPKEEVKTTAEAPKAAPEPPPVVVAAPAPKAEPPAEPVVKPEPPAKPEPAAKPEVAVKPEPVAKPEPVEEKPAPASSSSQKEILLEALDRVQINISVGGKSSKVSLNAGEVHILRTDEKVQLDISDGGAVNLVVNGRSRGVPGSLGQSKQVQIP